LDLCVYACVCVCVVVCVYMGERENTWMGVCFCTCECGWEYVCVREWCLWEWKYNLSKIKINNGSNVEWNHM
jgi:hypothetical protein